MSNPSNQNNQLNISLNNLSPEIREQIIIEQVDKRHPYKITPPSENDNRYSTYIKEKGAKRRYIKKTYKKDLYQALFNFYYGSKTSTSTLEEYFKEWLRFKNNYNSTRTLERNIQYWNKYYANTTFVQNKLDEIDFRLIEDFYIDLCNSITITKKEFSNIFTILKGILDLAVRNDIIDINPCNKVEKRLFKLQYNSTKTSETEILYKDELIKLLNTIDDELETNPSNQKALAIKLMLLTGARCGELSSIMFSDVTHTTYGPILNISRSEVTNPTVDIDNLSVNNYIPCVVNRVKTNNKAGTNGIAIPSTALDIINKLRDIHIANNINDEGYILYDEYGRIKNHRLAKYLTKLCKKANINHYSPHKLRKTYSSLLFSSNNALQLKDIQHQLRHTNLNTTMKYLFPLRTSEQLCKPIDDIFKNIQ